MPWLEHRYGHMVQEYLVARVREAAARRRAVWDALRTRQDALRLQADVRRKLRRCFGPLPPRTPLHARTTGRLAGPHYTIEKVLLESRPRFLVSANLYVPRDLRAPAPAVLIPCGHAAEGKASEVYQAVADGLARKGFVTLIYDPISQGERVQYPDAKGHCRLGLCAEHNMLGRQQALLGDWFGTWRVWDGLRCLDYLMARPEVDRARVGVTGNSGGGTLTGWLCANDDRIAMAGPGCWVTTFLSNAENELPADAEQIPPGALEQGLDFADCFVPRAPRPLILLTQAQDFFDPRGSRQAFEDLRRLYRLLGAEANVQLQVGPTRHGYSIHNRRAMYAFFTLHAGLPVSSREPPLRPRAAAELAAAPWGVVRRAGSRRVLDFTRDRATDLAAARRPVPAARLRPLLARLLALPPRAGAPHYRVLRHWGDGQMVWQGYAVETEPGIQALVTMRCPDGNQYAVPRERRCALLVPHLAAWEDLHDRRLLARLQPDGRVLAVDPRGIGQSLAQGCDAQDFFAAYDCDFFYDAHGILLGEPYLGRRVFDVLRTLDWLYACGYTHVHLAGRGLGAVTALLAAALEARVAHVTLVNALLSYDELTRVPIHRWPDAVQVRGALGHFDLPDALRAVAGKLTLVQPWDAQRRALPAARARARVRELGLPARVLAT